jgi:hypothetical protein
MNVEIDRIELTLDGVSAADARLLAEELPAALEARLSRAPGDEPAGDGPLASALRGQALVSAIASRLADAIAVETRHAAQGRTQRDTDAEETPWP